MSYLASRRFQTELNLKPIPGQTNCIKCPAGKFCSSATPIDVDVLLDPSFDCPEGYYCLEGTYHDQLYPCPRGYYGSGTGLKGIFNNSSM